MMTTTDDDDDEGDDALYNKLELIMYNMRARNTAHCQTCLSNNK